MASISLRPRFLAGLSAARHIRAIHTTIPALNDPFLPPQLQTAAELGFGGNEGRKRDLPTIDVNESVREDISGRSRKPLNDDKHRQNRKLRASPARKHVEVTELSPLNDGRQTITSPKVTQENATGDSIAAAQDNFFDTAAIRETPSQPLYPRKSSDERPSRRPFQRRVGGQTSFSGRSDGVEQSQFPRQSAGDSFERQPQHRPDSSLPRRGRPGGSFSSDRPVTDRFAGARTRSPRSREGGQGQQARPAARKPRRRRDGEDSARGVARQSRNSEPWIAPPETKVDLSWAALFGRESVLTPVIKPSRNAAESYWAKGMEPADARKQDVLRQAGSYDIYTPTSPLPSDPSVATKPYERAKAAAEWALALNKSVSMRQAEKAREVLKRFL
ncbi:hypothetical protein BCR39DRAFT_526352 [Naematelia encephala]|uniref:Uncharacterized protein n=1 Tax=Naematelia encephala TaxID=71784 RepID=A0A1Y2BA86_9TREE|nr:hypothetical protein BCR39DRAFT_526352 [Naematelia encephala]